MAAALVGIIVNVSPYISHLGRATSLKLIQLVDLYTRNSLSTSVEMNAMVLTHMVRAVNSMLEEYKPGTGSFHLATRGTITDMSNIRKRELALGHMEIWNYIRTPSRPQSGGRSKLQTSDGADLRKRYHRAYVVSGWHCATSFDCG